MVSPPLAFLVCVKRRRRKFVPAAAFLERQKSEYVFDVVVPAGAVAAGAEALGCCTVFSSLTLHAPSAATRPARATKAKHFIGRLLTIPMVRATARQGDGCAEPQTGAQR